MTPEYLFLVTESRSILLRALSESERYRKHYLSTCLELSQAASEALSLTLKLERAASAQQAHYAQRLEQQMAIVQTCQAALETLTQRVTQ
jgi:hypothetical protein